MEILKLTPNKIVQLQNDLTIIRTLPAISLATAINIQRSIKSLDKVIDDIKDDAKVLGERFANLKDGDKDGEKKLIKEKDELNDTKLSVKIHILKDSDFPKETKEFGFKEVPMQDGGTRKIYYIEAYLQLLDVVIIEASKFDDYIKSLKEEIKLQVVEDISQPETTKEEVAAVIN